MTMFFCDLLAHLCNGQMDKFIDICNRINLPISPEKTIPAATLMVFLGFLIDTVNRRVLIPCKKLARGHNMINHLLSICETRKASKWKITVHQLQKVHGFLNFLGRAIIQGRAFTRRLYLQLKNYNLMPHHHLRITEEMRLDLSM